VEEGGGYGLVAKTDVADDDLGHFDRVDDVRAAGAPADILMGFVGEIESLLHHIQLLLVGAALFRRGFKLGITLPDQLVVLFCKL